MQKHVFKIDGEQFSTLEEFYNVISEVLIPGEVWGCNLDAFNDILRGGFGTPESGFVLHWKNSHTSRNRLGFLETARQLEIRLTRCHPSNRDAVQQQILAAQRGLGSTVFDWLIEIIRDHGPGGEEAEDGVDLILE